MPQKEVADTPLARRADYEVRVGEHGNVEARCDCRLIDLVRRHTVFHQPAYRIDYLGAATVVEADVEDAAFVARRSLRRLVDALAHPLRQLVAPAADDDAHPAPVHLVDLALHRLVEEPHQRSHLSAGP